jgi:hypothetical protein
LEIEPTVDVGDLRVELPMSITRQIELAKWSLLMLRLTFVSDIGHHADGSSEPVARLAGFAEQAAVESNALNPAQLLRWIGRVGTRLFDSALPEKTYERLVAKMRAAADKEGG